MKPIALFAVGAVALVMGILVPTMFAGAEYIMIGIGVALLGFGAFFATGHNFGGPAGANVRDPMKVAASAPLQKRRVCKSCGAEIPSVANLCPKCGQ
jgi:ribosomal protein L40E